MTIAGLPRVAVAGIGAVTGYGWSRHDLWTGLASGLSCAQVTEIDGVEALAAVVPDAELDEGVATRMEHAVVSAVDEATTDARGRGWHPGDRVGLMHCTGIGEVQFMRDGYFLGATRRPSLFAHVLPTTCPSLIARRLEIHGPNLVVNAACASVNLALLMARQWLATGFATDVIVSSAEFCVIGEVLTGFRLLRVLAEGQDPFDACRPFQEGSSGFFLGEGATAVVVSPRTTGAYLEVLGGAVSHDAHHLTAVAAGGDQTARCFGDALGDAGVAASDVAYVHAHGTGTRVNDAIESEVVDRTFGPQTRLYSTKPLTGHCMAASAGVQLVATALAYEQGLVPAPCRVAPGHARLLDGPESRRPGPTACSAIGLGGYNSVVVVDAPRSDEEERWQ